MSSEPRWSRLRATSAASAGASRGRSVSAHMPADDGGGRLLEPRHLIAGATPILAHAPHEARQPGHARFHHDELQAREFHEGALGDEAEKLAPEALHMPDLWSPHRTTGSRLRWRMPIAAAGMDADWQAEPFGRRPNRPIDPPRRAGCRPSPAPALARSAGRRRAARSRLSGELGILQRQQDRGAQPRIAVEESRGEPIIGGATERRREIVVVDGLDAATRNSKWRSRARRRSSRCRCMRSSGSAPSCQSGRMRRGGVDG